MAFNRQDEFRKSKLLKIEDKWKLIFNQKTREPVYSPVQYADHLRKFTETDEIHENKDVRPVSYLLRKLKVDLQMSFISFIEEFTGDAIGGLPLLLKLLKITQKASRNAKNRVQQTKRLLTDEYDCLLCIKFALRLETVVSALLEESYGLETVASSLMSAFTKSRIVSLEIMNVMLTEPRGFSRNLDCFTYFRLKNGEPVRFRFLVSMLMSTGQHNVSFQICCMKFLNSLLSSTPDTNVRVYIQNELQIAGLDVEILQKTIEDRDNLECTELLRELKEFSDNNLDVDALIESRTVLESSYSTLQKQVSMLQYEVEMNRSRDFDFLSEDGLSDRTFPDPDIGLSGNVPDPPPLPPFSADGKHTLPKQFPFFHWVPLQSVENTIFQSVNETSVLDDEDIEQLDQAFKLRSNTKSSSDLVIRKKVKDPTKKSYLDCGRYTNIEILLRRIGRSPEEIKRALEEFETEVLSIDHIDLLIRLLPSDEEREILMSDKYDYEDLAESDQFLYQLLLVDSLEERLNILMYMGQFKSKITRIKPIIDAIKRSSVSLVNCLKIHKVFEIILYVGNHLQSNKQSGGFRLSSLASLLHLQSRDRTFTLMDFLVTIILKRFPEIRDWDLELDFSPISKCSYTALTVDLKELKEGMASCKQMSSSCHSDKLDAFFSTGTRSLNEVTNEFVAMEKSYRRVCEMYGENCTSTMPSDFFHHFYQLANAYKKSKNRILSGSKTEITNPLEEPLTRVRYLTNGEGYVQATPDNCVECNKDNMEYQNINLTQSPPLPSDCLEVFAFLNDHDDAEALYESDLPKSEQVQQTAAGNEADNIELEPDYSVDLYMGSDLDLCEEESLDVDYPQDLGTYVCEPYDMIATKTSKVENWIMKSNEQLRKEEAQKYHIMTVDGNIGNQCRKQVVNHRTRLNSESDGSCDSAFCGSDGNILRSDSNKSQYGVQHSDPFQRSSTPNQVILSGKRKKTLAPPDEPPPDYPCSKTGSIRSNTSYSSEISRILNDFEGNLNKYDTDTIGRTQKPFYTVRSIIYL